MRTRGHSTVGESVIMSKAKQLRPQHEHVQRKARTSSSDSAAESDDDIGTLVRDSLIQRRALKGGAPDNTAVRDAAAKGVASPTTALPHAAAIQAAFGSDHDVSQINAHVGGGS